MKNLYFLRRGGGGGWGGALEGVGKGAPIINFLSLLLLVDMKMLYIKFHQNHNINVEFFFFWGGALRGAGELNNKNSKKPHKERWS